MSGCLARCMWIVSGLASVRIVFFLPSWYSLKCMQEAKIASNSLGMEGDLDTAHDSYLEKKLWDKICYHFFA